MRRARLPRLLGAAPASEGDRGGAAAGRSPPQTLRGCSRPRRPPRAAVGYVGVGTVEFLVAGDAVLLPRGEPAAAGRARHHRGDHRRRPGAAADPHRARRARIADVAVAERGSAIEARVCAEDPDAGFLPAPGRIARFDPALGPRVRVDTGVVAGSVIPAAFDSLIAKVIATRRDARRGARAAWRRRSRATSIWSSRAAPPTRATCSSCSRPALRAGGVDTGWLDRATAAPAPLPAAVRRERCSSARRSSPTSAGAATRAATSSPTPPTSARRACRRRSARRST